MNNKLFVPDNENEEVDRADEEEEGPDVLSTVELSRDVTVLHAAIVVPNHNPTWTHIHGGIL